VSPAFYKSFPSELGSFPVEIKRGNTFNSQSLEPKKETPGVGQVALGEIAKLRSGEAELGAVVAEQQRITSHPVRGPPAFGCGYFDYPIFMRAFETIIEACVFVNKEQLYFLSKCTTGKVNDIIKSFVTLTSGDSYKRSKNLLAQRFGDPLRVSNAYKSRLKNWLQIGEGQSNDL